METNNHYEAIIIGAGPAGLTAGIYLSRSKIKTLILDQGIAGGQLILTHEIANYPGVENISGYALSNIMKKQALSFGCTIKTNLSLAEISLKNEVKKITATDGITFTADAIILTPGGRSKMLDVAGEEKFKGRGISYCATCDGDFFTNKEIIVVGGGNTALEEAVSLTKYASKVTIIHKNEKFKAFPHAIEELKKNNKIDIMLDSVIQEFYGLESLNGAIIKNLRTGNTIDFKTDGAFIFIGYQPNTEFLKNKILLNDWGEIYVDSHMQTSIDGVFAAGDSIQKPYRQITTAVGEATTAALAAINFIYEHKNNFVVSEINE